MKWTSRVSARITITLVTTAASVFAVVLLSGVIKQQLMGADPLAVSNVLTAVRAVGLLLSIFIGIVAWFAAGILLRPFHELRSSLRLPDRARALDDPAGGEMSEAHALRMAMLSLVVELESHARNMEMDQRRILAMFEAITEGILQIGRSGKISHANAAARSLLNLPAAVEGKAAASLVRSSELRNALEAAARHELLAPAEIVLDDRQLVITPQRHRYSEDEDAIVSVVDLTELRRLETVRRDFVANVSHELKTPLTSIRGYAETLAAEDLPRATQIEFLQIIQRNTARIQKIVDELLDLSRLQSGGWIPQLQRVDAIELAQDVWTGCIQAAAGKSAHLHIDENARYVVADPGGLRQILSNLFDNAIRYSADQGRVTVAVRASERHEGMAEIEVQDEGTGIPSEAIPRIFERFYRVQQARSRDDGGTGLGLAIVKHLVERMGGEVSAESALGKGTRIRFTLPAA